MRLNIILCAAFFIAGCEESASVGQQGITVYASAETEPVKGKDDAADDPAIWVHPRSPEDSLILGTDKKKGLAVYNLQGVEVGFLPRGRLNNVDLRQNIPLKDNTITLAVATNRTEKTLDIFEITSTGQVVFREAQPLTMKEPYGTCMYLDKSGAAHVFANSKSGEYQQWQLTDGDAIAPRLVGTFRLDFQPEGCVADDSDGTLYFGEEERGLWRMPADVARFDQRQLIDEVANGKLVADIEGMDIYRGSNGEKFLVVSSQGNHSYALYDISGGVKATNHYRGSFRIVDNPDNSVDGTEETDGLAVSSSYLGSDYPKGLLVVQDGFNRLPNANQNFKLVSWEQIEQALPAVTD